MKKNWSHAGNMGFRMPFSVHRIGCAKMKRNHAYSNLFEVSESKLPSCSWATVRQNRIDQISTCRSCWQAVFKTCGHKSFQAAKPQFSAWNLDGSSTKAISRCPGHAPAVSLCHFLANFLERWLGRKTRTSSNNFLELLVLVCQLVRPKPNPKFDRFAFRFVTTFQPRAANGHSRCPMAHEAGPARLNELPLSRELDV